MSSRGGRLPLWSVLLLQLLLYTTYPQTPFPSILTYVRATSPTKTPWHGFLVSQLATSTSECATVFPIPSNADSISRALDGQQQTIGCGAAESALTLLGLRSFDSSLQQSYHVGVDDTGLAFVEVFDSQLLIRVRRLSLGSSSFSPLAFERLSTGLLFVLGFDTSAPPAQQLQLWSLDPALSDTQTPGKRIIALPAGQNVLFGVSALLAPSTVGGVGKFLFASLSASPSAARIFAVSLTDGALSAGSGRALPADVLEFHVADDVDTLLVLRENAMGTISISSLGSLLDDGSSSSAVPITNFDVISDHFTQASIATQCGSISTLMLTSSYQRLPDNTSSLLTAQYATPSDLSDSPDPFLYLLALDPTSLTTQYQMIDSAPAQFDEVIPIPVIHSISPSFVLNSNPVLTISGSDFSARTPLSCTLGGSTVTSTLIGPTSAVCTFSSVSTVGSVDLSISAWNRVALVHQNVTLVNTASTNTQAILSSRRKELQRMLLSLQFSSQLTTETKDAKAKYLASAGSTSGTGRRRLLQATTGVPNILQSHTAIQRALGSLLSFAQTIPTDGSPNAADAIAQAVSHLANDANQFMSSGGFQDILKLIDTGGTLGGPLTSSISGLAQLVQGASSFLPTQGASLPSVFQTAGPSVALTLDMLSQQAMTWMQQQIQQGGITSPLPFGSIDASSLSAIGNPLLQGISSSSLEQLTSLVVNSVLTAADSNPILKTILNDPSIQALTGLDLGDLSQPEKLLDGLVLPGNWKNTISQLVDDGVHVLEGDFSSIGDDFAGLLNGLSDDIGRAAGFAGQDLQRFTATFDVLSDTAQMLENSVSDVIDAFKSGGPGIAGPVHGTAIALGALGSFIATAFGADPNTASDVSKVVSGVVDIGSAVAELFLGDIADGIEGLINGIGDLFGGGNNKRKFEQSVINGLNQLAQGISTVDQHVLAGFKQTDALIAESYTRLSGQISALGQEMLTLTQALENSISQQLVQEYQQTATALRGIIGDLQIIGTTQQVQFQQLRTQLAAFAYSSFANTLSNALFALQQQIQRLDAMIGSYADLPRPRQLELGDVQSYQAAISTLLSFGFPGSTGLTYISGQLPDTVSVSTLAAQIRLTPHYDLVYGFIPHILAMPEIGASLPSSFRDRQVYNPMTWATVVNVYLEARMAFIDQAGMTGYDQLGASQLWAEGGRIQATMRAAIQPRTLFRLLRTWNTTVNAARAEFQSALLRGYTPSQLMQSLSSSALPIAPANPAVYQQYDDWGVLVSLMLQLARLSGLSTNGFQSGYIPGTAASSQLPLSTDVLSYLSAGNSRTKIPFFALSTIAEIQSAIGTYLSPRLSSTDPITSTDITILSASGNVIFNHAFKIIEKAVASFYPDCLIQRFGDSAVSPIANYPIVDVAMRRLAAFMLRRGISFTYQGFNMRMPSTTYSFPPWSTSGGCSFSAPVNGNLGSCTAFLRTGDSCRVQCNVGYVVTNGGITSCTSPNSLISQTCVGVPCNITAPTNGTMGSCQATLASGSSCQFLCSQGFQLIGLSTTCEGGIPHPQSCAISPEFGDSSNITAVCAASVTATSPVQANVSLDAQVVRIGIAATLQAPDPANPVCVPPVSVSLKISGTNVSGCEFHSDQLPYILNVSIATLRNECKLDRTGGGRNDTFELLTGTVFVSTSTSSREEPLFQATLVVRIPLGVIAVATIDVTLSPFTGSLDTVTLPTQQLVSRLFEYGHGAASSISTTQGTSIRLVHSIPRLPSALSMQVGQWSMDLIRPLLAVPDPNDPAVLIPQDPQVLHLSSSGFRSAQNVSIYASSDLVGVLALDINGWWDVPSGILCPSGIGADPCYLQSTVFGSLIPVDPSQPLQRRLLTVSSMSGPMTYGRSRSTLSHQLMSSASKSATGPAKGLATSTLTIHDPVSSPSVGNDGSGSQSGVLFGLSSTEVIIAACAIVLFVIILVVCVIVAIRFKRKNANGQQQPKSTA